MQATLRLPRLAGVAVLGGLKGSASLLTSETTPGSELLTALETAFNVIPNWDWMELDCCVFLLFITFTVKGAVRH